MKHEDKKQWTKRKRYGYGWSPASWQAWVVLAVYLVAVTLSGLYLLSDVPDNTFTSEVGVFLGVTAVLTIILVSIMVSRGPKAKWQWSKADPADHKKSK